MRTVYYSLVQDAYKLNGRKTTGKEEQMNVQLTQCTVDPAARPPANRLKKKMFHDTQKIRKTSAEEW